MIELTADPESGEIYITGLTAAQGRKIGALRSVSCGVLPGQTSFLLERNHAAMCAILQTLAGQTITISDVLFDCFTPPDDESLLAMHDAQWVLATKTDPWQHQITGTQAILDRRWILLGADCGTGKTKMLIDAYQTARRRRMLIFAPKAVTMNYPREIAAHALPNFDVFLANDVTQTIAQRAHDIMAFMGPFGRDGILVVDHATAWREPIARLLHCYPWDVIAVDEAHAIRNPDNNLSQLVYQLCDENPDALRVAMTATPLGNNPLSVYGIGRFVAPQVVGLNKWAFDHKWGNFKTKIVRTPKGEREIEVFDGLKNDDAFTAMMAPWMFRVSKDVLDLPPQTHNRRFAILDAKARAAYRQLCKELATEYKGRTFSAQYAQTLQMRCQQFTGLYKQDVLEELLAEMGGEPVVIYARFVEDLAIIRAAAKSLKLDYLEQSGRANQWQQFQDGAGVILGVQYQSGGSGVNLTRAAQAIYYSHGPSNNDYDQSLSRMHRPGQDRHVHYTHLIVANTVDETITDAAIEGRDFAQALLRQTEKKAEAYQHAA